MHSFAEAHGGGHGFDAACQMTNGLAKRDMVGFRGISWDGVEWIEHFGGVRGLEKPSFAKHGKAMDADLRQMV